MMRCILVLSYPLWFLFQAKVFTKEALHQFFKTFDRNCPYQLVRAAYAVVCYLGSNRNVEIKDLKRGSK